MKKIIWIMILTLINISFLSCDNSGNSVIPEYIFRYAENQPENHPATLGAFKFAELVNERTDGRIKIVIYHDAELGNEAEVIQQLTFGGIDFARLSLTQLATVYDSLSVLNLPFLYNDDEHMRRVLDGDIGNYFLKINEEPNIYGLSWYNAGARSFYTTTPVYDVDDLKELRIRIQGNPMSNSLVSLFEAIPVSIHYGEVYSALKIGEIDGAENNLPSYESSLHYETAKFVFLSEHMRIPEMQVVSRNVMEKLSPEDLEIIKECARESAVFQRDEWEKREKISEEICKEAGVIITVPSVDDIKHMQELCRPLYEIFTSDNMDIVNRIIELR